jgi:hypothetical protein
MAKQTVSNQGHQMPSHEIQGSSQTVTEIDLIK